MLSVNLLGLKFVRTANTAIITIPPMGHKNTCVSKANFHNDA